MFMSPPTSLLTYLQKWPQVLLNGVDGQRYYDDDDDKALTYLLMMMKQSADCKNEKQHNIFQLWTGLSYSLFVIAEGRR